MAPSDNDVFLDFLFSYRFTLIWNLESRLKINPFVIKSFLIILHFFLSMLILQKLKF